MTTYRVVMVRHGESQWNKENKFCGWFDAELSEKGMYLILYWLHICHRSYWKNLSKLRKLLHTITQKLCLLLATFNTQEKLCNQKPNPNSRYYVPR